MRDRWTHLCGNSDRITVDALYDVIEAMYRRPGHHTLRHVSECLDIFAEVGMEPNRAWPPEVMEFAIWLHDVVYIPGRTDNEKRSLIVANMMLQELGKGWMVGLVWELIRATMHDLPVETKAAAHQDDELMNTPSLLPYSVGLQATKAMSLMADIDLSILGSDPARYDEYAGHIRQEFSSVADKLYRAARTVVLEGFLARKRIFSTAIIGGRFEVQARENMTREIEELARSVVDGGRLHGRPQEEH